MNETFQEQVARLRRAQIISAATTVFAERGFHRTTIRGVAKAAGVADGTIYNYFENKTALLLALLDPLDELGEHTAAAGPPLDMPSDLREFFRATFARRLSAFSGDNLPVLRVVLSEALVSAEVRGLFVERVIASPLALAEPLFRQLVADGKLRPINVPLMLRTLSATFLGLAVLRLLGDSVLQDGWEDLPDLLTDLLLDGMLPGGGTVPGERNHDDPV